MAVFSEPELFNVLTPKCVKHVLIICLKKTCQLRVLPERGSVTWFIGALLLPAVAISKAPEPFPFDEGVDCFKRQGQLRL